MKLGFVSDSLAHLSFEEMLDHAARLGLDGVEVNMGGWSGAPHVDRALLLSDNGARDRFLRDFASRGLQILALNAIGNPLHPDDRSQADCLVDTIRLAGALGIETVVTTSGLPAGNSTDTCPNWTTNSWTSANRKILRYQWEDVLFPFWTGIAALARESGVRQIAITLGANQCVHNVPTLLQLREEIGPQIGANLDTAQQMLMGADPVRSVGALRDSLYHVHAKDVLLNQPVLDVTSLIDTGSLLDIDERAWSFVTPGYGHNFNWWARFCYQLAAASFEGNICIEHGDLVMPPLQAVKKASSLLRSVMPNSEAHGSQQILRD